MFYPVNSLRRGGRFYMCWVADSWPLRFATLTREQLWSQDIRDICDDLTDVITQESGMISTRFSLRLSSQLMRGLVRLYQKKTVVFISELCMIQASVYKLTNKKWRSIDAKQRPVRRPKTDALPRQVRRSRPAEENVEEQIQNSTNIVANIEEITLKEAELPGIIVPVDGFGEENPEQAFQLLNDKTIELMLGPTDHSVVQHSVEVERTLDVTEKSHDRTRLGTTRKFRLDRLTDHDVTFKKSITSDELLPVNEKDVQPIPESPVPLVPSPVKVPVPEPQEEQVETVQPVEQPAAQVEEFRLLEVSQSEIQRPKRRQRNRKLIIDKKIQISGHVLRARIEQVNVEQRCESSSDIVDPYVLHSLHAYMHRPAYEGWRIKLHNYSDPILNYMYTRNLGVAVLPDDDSELENMLAGKEKRRRTPVIKITEEPVLEPCIVSKPVQEQLPELIIEHEGVNIPLVVIEPIDISLLPTQVLEQSNERKRSAEVLEYSPDAKKIRHGGFVSFKLSQHQQEERSLIEKDNQAQLAIEPPPEPTLLEETFPVLRGSEVENERIVSQMLEEVGLADATNILPAPESRKQSESRRITREEREETPLGSLDRTKVDLGESDESTDTQRFLRLEWGTQGTMIKISRLINKGVRPLTMSKIIKAGPIIGNQRQVVTRCFTALLKLKQHNFLVLKKDNTHRIVDISFGSKIQSM